MDKLNQLKKYLLDCETISVYDYDGESIQELLCQFYTKINQCVKISNDTIDIVDYLMNQGLDKSVATEIEKMYKDGRLSDIISDVVLKSFEEKLDLQSLKTNGYVTPQMFGCIGDGKTDDTINFKACLTFATTNNMLIRVPQGTYIINQTISVVDGNDIGIDDSFKPVNMVGDGNKCYFDTTNGTEPTLNFSRTRFLNLENIKSTNSWIHCMQYGGDFRYFTSIRRVKLINVGSEDRFHGYPSWSFSVSCPAPRKQSNEEQDANYVHYPIEISSCSGYNPIMINNFANISEESDGGVPGDNSSIGIVDEVSNGTSVILIDCGTRSSWSHQNSGAESKSESVRYNTVSEIGILGDYATGCSSVNQVEAPSTNGTVFKGRRKYPNMRLYDQNRNNRQFEIAMGDDRTSILNKNENEEITNEMRMNYKTNEIDFPNSILVYGRVLNITKDNKPSNTAVNVSGLIYINFKTDFNLEYFDNGFLGQTISVSCDIGVNCWLKADRGIYGFSQDVQLGEKPIRFVRAVNGWFIID